MNSNLKGYLDNLDKDMSVTIKRIANDFVELKDELKKVIVMLFGNGRFNIS